MLISQLIYLALSKGIVVEIYETPDGEIFVGQSVNGNLVTDDPPVGSVLIDMTRVLEIEAAQAQALTDAQSQIDTLSTAETIQLQTDIGTFEAFLNLLPDADLKTGLELLYKLVK